MGGDTGFRPKKILIELPGRIRFPRLSYDICQFFTFLLIILFLKTANKPAALVLGYSLLLICAHGRIKSNQRTFCKTTVQLEAAMDIVKKTRSY